MYIYSKGFFLTFPKLSRVTAEIADEKQVK